MPVVAHVAAYFYFDVTWVAAFRSPGRQDEILHLDAPKLYRHFVRGKGAVSVNGSQVTVSFPRRAHDPILRDVPWENLPSDLTLPSGARLTLRFG